MGAAESTEKLGQRVLVSKEKLKTDLVSATQRFEYLQKNSPQTLATMLQSVSDSFANFAPFLESTLLIAWLYDAEKCKDVVLKACKKVLRAPIQDAEYDWFKQYVFTSNVWMLKSQSTAKFMYKELLDIGKEMSSGIVANMDSIYAHLTLHPKWDKVMAINNETRVPRQDDGKVGLLQEAGLTSVFEMKSESDDDATAREDMKNYIDSNMAINMLTATASKINDEFQRHVRLVMSSHGTFKPAPMKKVERSISKLENDYKNESFPKSAKLLDLVRCSVTFNTVEQLCSGFEALVNHATANGGILELARVKNGFLDKNSEGGYRDIKVNVVYTSQNPEHQNVKMVCEVQLLLINYLEEKKKIHKLYSILREETYFDMVAKQQQPQSGGKDVTKLKFTEKLNVGKQVNIEKLTSAHMNKSSVDSELELLAMECGSFFGVVDMKSNSPIFEVERECQANQSHHWITIKGKKYLSLQTRDKEITMFQVVAVVKDDQYTITVEDSISFCEFDGTFEHILLVVDQNVLQIRSMQDVQTVSKSIKLEERVGGSKYRNLRLSADGTLCALSGGIHKQYFYVIDIIHEKQIKVTSQYLKSAYVPCFINGENQFVALGDSDGRIEIWDIDKKQPVKQLENESENWIMSSASVHNILAIGENKILRLYDVRNWECFYQKEMQCKGYSLHLTEDLQYVTFAGQGRDKCVVLQIE